MARTLFLEAFYGGSHKQLLDIILNYFDSSDYDLHTIPAKKWHWCARMSALFFAGCIPTTHEYRTVFCSSVLNLAELIGIRPDLANCRKIVYFHENQLCYPVRDSKERDVQYGMNQITTCISADMVLFNSQYNLSSFLDNIQPFLNVVPNMSFKGIRENIERKCHVLFFPIGFKNIPTKSMKDEGLDYPANKPLYLIWPHRWEHDKNPEQLTDALVALQGKGVDFRISILGERFETIPKCFENLSDRLLGKILHFGPLSKEDYYETLTNGDVVLSTALHEFYGVAMLEAIHCGCIPLAPNRLVYPELYPDNNLFNTTAQLVKQLYNWCRNRKLFEKHRDAFFSEFRLDKHSEDKLVPEYISIIKRL